MKAEHIQREISINESEFHTRGECVSCGSKMRPIDIATQGVHQPSAGMYTCQMCLPIEMRWFDLDW
jgi:hypothetical protein